MSTAPSSSSRCRAPLEDRYYVVAEAGLGGKLVEAALNEAMGRELADGPPDAIFEQALQTAAKSPPGSRGVMFLPWVFGAMAPSPDPRHRGAFLGISLSTSRADLVRAHAGGCRRCRCVGSPTRSRPRSASHSTRCASSVEPRCPTCGRTILADVVGRPIEQLDNPRHANARGAGLMAFVSTGQLAIDDLADLVPVHARYEPDPATRALWDDRLGVFRDVHAALGGTRFPPPPMRPTT